MLKDGTIILFQGDSITDAGRSRTDDRRLGVGYPRFVRERLMKDRPAEQFCFINRGVSGNRAKDLVARWEKDCIAVKPDYVSILIGVNDTWRRYDAGDETTAAMFRENMTVVIESTLARTNAEILLLNPFLLDIRKSITAMREDLDGKQRVIAELAKEYGTRFVDLDAVFSTASQTQPPAAFSGDGVHPTPLGHELIAEHWLKAWE